MKRKVYDPQTRQPIRSQALPSLDSALLRALDLKRLRCGCIAATSDERIVEACANHVGDDIYKPAPREEVWLLLGILIIALLMLFVVTR